MSTSTGFGISLNQAFLMLGGCIVFFMALSWLFITLISMLNYRYTPVKDRLLLLKKKTKGEFFSTEGQGGLFDQAKMALLAFSGPISKSLYGQNKKYVAQVKTLLTEAGLPDQDAYVAQFMTRRVAMGLIIGSVLFIVTIILVKELLFVALFFLLAGFVAGSLLPQIALRTKASQRKMEIRHTMSDVLDLMVVCVEAGLALDATIQRVADEMGRIAPQLSMEFKRLSKELNAGIARSEAFQNLGQRSGVDELRSLCAMIIQSDKMGSGIADTLRVYADDLRVRRRQHAEELAAKASIKMTFPLVFFIFPPLFIVLMGPIVIQVIHQFFSK